MRRPDAFSVLELLIVVAIIGVLAGILLVVFHAVREHSKMASCLSNLRQIGIALNLYRQDYGGIDAIPGQEMKYWQLGLPAFRHLEQFREGYVKDQRVFHCPGYFGWIDPFTYVGLPLHRVITYQWCIDDDMPTGEASGFSARLAEMGEMVPICICEVHNRPARPEAPSSLRKRVNILRLNQQVVSTWVPIRSTACGEVVISREEGVRR
jgi:prepilin-type N-terminal cleavage/methylation domain-containing protein